MRNINLMGHHIRVLYRHYIKGASLRVIRAKITEDYNEEHAMKVVRMLSDIVKNKVQITFIDDLDDICQGCPIYTSKFCGPSSYNSNGNQRYLKKFGFSIGKQYSAKEVLRGLKENNYIKWLSI